MDFHPALKDQILIQSAEDGESWHTSNYSLIRISGQMIRFFDFEETLIQEFPYTIDDESNILILPDMAPFGRILQQGSERLMIGMPDAKPLHFTRVPGSTLKMSSTDIESLMAGSVWSSHQLGVQLRFTYVSNQRLQAFKKNTGIPETNAGDEIAFQFTIVQPFDKWFLLIFAEGTLVEAFPVHMISEQTIEVYASLMPPAIRVLSLVADI